MNEEKNLALYLYFLIPFPTLYLYFPYILQTFLLPSESPCEEKWSNEKFATAVIPNYLLKNQFVRYVYVMFTSLRLRATTTLNPTEMKQLLLTFALLASSQLFAQDFSIKMLEDSPRHHEWVDVSHGERVVHSFVAYPEVSENAPTIIVIHENRGLTDWVRSFADQLAAAGYIAIAPDLLSEFSEDIHLTSDFETSDAARDAIYKLDADQVTADLEAVKTYIENVPGSTGEVVVIGFCWGGSQSFRFATNNNEIEAAMVFYGSPPAEMADLERIDAPVYGFYGEQDQRINATIESTKAMMDQAGKTYEPVIYPGVGHAFMRRGNDPAEEDVYHDMFDKAFKRVQEIMAAL